MGPIKFGALDDERLQALKVVGCLVRLVGFLVFPPGGFFLPGILLPPMAVVSTMRVWYYLLLHPVASSQILTPWYEPSCQWCLISIWPFASLAMCINCWREISSLALSAFEFPHTALPIDRTLRGTAATTQSLQV